LEKAIKERPLYTRAASNIIVSFLGKLQIEKALFVLLEAYSISPSESLLNYLQYICSNDHPKSNILLQFSSHKNLSLLEGQFDFDYLLKKKILVHSLMALYLLRFFTNIKNNNRLSFPSVVLGKLIKSFIPPHIVSHNKIDELVYLVRSKKIFVSQNEFLKFILN
jgi:hypothetical protein